MFNPRKTTLLFVIRDKSRTPLEKLQSNLREDLDRIWATITKPERHAEAAFDDFFELRFVALAGCRVFASPLNAFFFADQLIRA